MYKLDKSNHKGFTLMELIIAIAIFTIVITIGYNLINKYNSATKTQSNISETQMVINNINKYITKDLEKATGITLKCIEPNETEIYTITNEEAEKDSDYLQNAIHEIQQRNKITPSSSRLIYQYTINSIDGQKSPSYVVELQDTKKDNNIECSIYRTSQEEPTIDFTKKFKIKNYSETFNIPFSIIDKNPYIIKINLGEVNDISSNYEFKVLSRYTSINSNDDNSGGENTKPLPPNPDEIPIPPVFGSYSMIGYWTANKSTCKQENLYTWIMDKGDEQPSGKFGTQVTDGPFDIRGETRPEDNHKASSHIENKNKWTVEIKDRSIKYKNISQVGIYVSKGTTLNNVKFDTSIGQGISIYLEDENGVKYNTLYGGQEGNWYECTMDITKNNPKVNFIVDGELSIDESVASGYAVVVYGESNSSDIIFEFMDLKQGPNSNQRTVDLGTAYKGSSGDFTYKKQDNAVVGSNQIEEMHVNLHIQSKYGNLSTFMQPGGYPSISLNNNEVYKDLSKMKRIRITMDKGISINSNTSNYNSLIRVNDTTYEAKINNVLNMDFKFDISRLYMNSINSGRVYIELFK